MSRRTIVLEGGKPWGFRIKGGKEFSIPVFIEEVTSAKAKNSGLLKNDVVLEINGQNVSDCQHNFARNLIVNAISTLTLVVEASESDHVAAKPAVKSAPKQKPEITATRSIATLPSGSKSSASEVEDMNTAKKEPVKSFEVTKSQPAKAKPEDSKVSLSLKMDDDMDTVKSPYMRRLANEPHMDHTMQTGGGLTHIDKAVTLDKPVEIKPAAGKSRVTIGGSLANAPKNLTAIPAGGIGGRVTAPETKDFIKEKSSNNTSHIKIDNSASLFTCKKCKEAITDSSAVNAHGGYYHTNHFTCSDCDKPLTSTKLFETSNKNLVCQSCYENSHSKKCFFCGKGISGQYLSASDKHFHVGCFKCSGCQKSLENCGFIVSGTRFLCQDCNNMECGSKCIRCDKFIVPGESYVKMQEESIHSSCFQCHTCQDVLSSFKQRDGNYFCPKH